MKKKSLILVCSLCAALIVAAGAVCGVALNKKSKITTIAFYNLPEEYQNAIKENLSLEKVNFIQFDEKSFLSPKISSKANIVISYNDARIQQLKNSGAVIPQKIQKLYANSIKSSEFYTNDQKKMTVLPVLFDQFEFGVLKITQSRYGAKLPENLNQFDAFCDTVKPQFPIPMIISGADDINVNSLFSLLVQSYGGLEGYLNVADQLSKTTDFSEIYDYQIGGEAPEEITIRTALDTILHWQNNGYLNSDWIINTTKNTDKFVENAAGAVSFMNMSEQRNKPKPTANNFKPEIFPLQTAQTFVNVQPAIVAVELKSNSGTKAAFEQLTDITAQEKLSEQTKLAPAILQGEAYDSLATSARYNAASYASGPVPDLGTLSLLSQADRHQLAQAIRIYCGLKE